MTTAHIQKGRTVKQNSEISKVQVNIKTKLHTALKVKAATDGTTIGKLIERWVTSWATGEPKKV